jgi:signal transduction histidine kinase
MKDKALSAEDRLLYLEIAYRQSDHMNVLIDELFELVKLEDFTADTTAEPFQLGELAQDVAQKFELIAQQKGVLIEGRFDPELPLVLGDVALIERLLDNLIENSIRHTKVGDRIVVSVENAGDHVTLEVSDTGSGISKDDLPYIFKRFFRAGGLRNSGGGAGLGLAIVKRIVELHGGSIEVRSDVGAGATFTVEFPLRGPLPS